MSNFSARGWAENLSRYNHRQPLLIELFMEVSNFNGNTHNNLAFTRDYCFHKLEDKRTSNPSVSLT